MLTKTGELLMRKKNENPQQNRPISKQLPQDIPLQPSQAPIPQRTPRHISHINQYNFISISNKSSRELQVSKEVLQQLEVQNFRLIEENMRLVQWSRGFLNKTRQSIMRVIQGIEEFRYLDSVNKLYEVIGELSEYQENGFQMPNRSSTKQHYLNLKKIANSEARNGRVGQLQMRKLQQFTYNPKDYQPKLTKIQEKQAEIAENIFPVGKSFLPQKMKADFSDFQPTSTQTSMFNMLLLQSIAIQSFIIQSFMEPKIK